MAISKKPKPQSSIQPHDAAIDEAAVLEVINRGGSVPVRTADSSKGEVVSEKDKEEKHQKFVQLRLDADFLEAIDDVRRKNRYSARTRHAWIVDAIMEKMQRDRKRVQKMAD